MLADQTQGIQHILQPTRYTPWATKVFGVDKQWQADWVDMQKFRRYNSVFGYVLCVINVFSKYAFVVPIK